MLRFHLSLGHYRFSLYTSLVSNPLASCLFRLCTCTYHTLYSASCRLLCRLDDKYWTCNRCDCAPTDFILVTTLATEIQSNSTRITSPTFRACLTEGGSHEENVRSSCESVGDISLTSTEGTKSQSTGCKHADKREIHEKTITSK